MTARPPFLPLMLHCLLQWESGLSYREDMNLGPGSHQIGLRILPSSLKRWGRYFSQKAASRDERQLPSLSGRQSLDPWPPKSQTRRLSLSSGSPVFIPAHTKILLDKHETGFIAKVGANFPQGGTLQRAWAMATGISVLNT